MTTLDTERLAGPDATGVGVVIPGIVLRGALAAAGIAAVALVASGMPGGLVVILVIAALAAARWPDSAVPLLLIVAVMVARIAGEGVALDAVTLVLAGLLLLIHQLAGIIAVMAPRSTIELAALRPALWRYLAATIPVLIAGIALL